MKRSVLSIAGLTLLLFLLDRVYRALHPEVNLLRAGLVGLSALAVLAPLGLLRRRLIDPLTGALSVYASAFLSVVLIQMGCLVSRSPASGLVHVLILAAAFLVFDRLHRRFPPRRNSVAGCRFTGSRGNAKVPYPARRSTPNFWWQALSKQSLRRRSP